MKKCIYARCKRDVPEDAAFCPYCGRKQVRERSRKTCSRAKGTGSVYKLSGNRKRPYYAVRNGISTGRTYATRQEAERALDAMCSAARPELFSWSLEDCYNAWSAVAYRDMGRSSRRSYELSWRYIPEPLRRKLARDVRTDDLQRVIDNLQARGLSDSTANHVKFLYSKLCQWMMQRDLIGKNYAAFLTVRRTEHRPIQTFTVDKAVRINALANGDPEERLTQTAMLTMILLFTGMRISELFTLPAASVHLNEPVPYLQGGVKTQAGRNRIIPIHRRILPFVCLFHSHATGSLLVSGYQGNKRPDGWRARDYAKLLDTLKIPYRVPHNTRKTMATQAAQEGVDQIALAKLLGWSDIAVGNQYYIAPEAAYLASEMEKLDGWDRKLAQGSPVCQIPADGSVL